MAWNIFCASNILEFIDEMLQNNIHPNQFILNAVIDPIEQSIYNLTKKRRDALLENIKQRITSIDDKFFLHKVYKEMIEMLQKPLLDTHQTALYNMLMDLDKKRKLNSKEVFPELYTKD